jgi:ParB family chromosome partitioning protein
MARYEIKPSLSQAVRLKKMSQAGELTADAIHQLLSQEKKPPDKLKVSARFRDYFPPGCPEDRIESVIIELLTAWKAKTTA